MSSRIAVLKKISPSFIAYIGAVLVVLAIGYSLHLERYLGFIPHKPQFDAATIVAGMGKGDKSVFEDIRDSLNVLIKDGGIVGALSVDKYAMDHNLMGIYQCHVLTHLIGHDSIIYYGNDYDAVEKNDNHFCEYGYRHGAEAQVTLEGGDYKDELYKLCDAIKRRDQGAECFHGAGHAFMNETLDVHKSLTLCDGLIDAHHTVEDVSPCYNAVFAELTNLVGGRDGETAIPYTGGPPLSITESSPLEYCSKLGNRYRIQCLFEFSGLGLGPSSTSTDVEKKLAGCALQGYDAELESACVRSVSAVGTQHLLASQQTIVVPQLVFSWSDVLRQAYIKGTATEMYQYITSGATRDWRPFCDAFTDSDDHALCTGIFAQQG